MAKQNPQSIASPGVSTGGATVLPSTPFDPQKFFDDMLEVERTELLHKAKEDEKKELYNQRLFEKLTKHEKDHWDQETERIQGMINGAMDETVEMFAKANTERRRINFSEQQEIQNKWGPVHTEIAASQQKRALQKKVQDMYNAKGGHTFYDPAGMEQMWIDVEEGKFSADRIDLYLIPDKEVEYGALIKQLAAEISTHTQYSGTRIDKGPAGDYSAAEEMWKYPAHPFHRFIRQQERKAIESKEIEDTEEARKKFKEELYRKTVNATLQSFDTAAGQRAQTVINYGAPGAAKDDIFQGYYSDNITSTKGRFPAKYQMRRGETATWESYGALELANILKDGAVDLRGNNVHPEAIRLMPVATYDITYKRPDETVVTYKRGEPVLSQDMHGIIAQLFTEKKSSEKNVAKPIQIKEMLYARGNKAPYVYALEEDVKNNLIANQKKGVNFFTDKIFDELRVRALVKTQSLYE